MRKLLEALKLALEALEALEAGHSTVYGTSQAVRAITAIREALAEQPPCKTGSQCTSKCEQCRYKYECDKAEQHEPVKIEYWLQDTMESGRWVTTDNMARATAEKMLSGEYGDVYPQGRIVEPSPPASKPWVGLTDEEVVALKMVGRDLEFVSMTALRRFARDIEAKLREKNA